MEGEKTSDSMVSRALCIAAKPVRHQEVAFALPNMMFMFMYTAKFPPPIGRSSA